MISKAIKMLEKTLHLRKQLIGNHSISYAQVLYLISLLFPIIFFYKNDRFYFGKNRYFNDNFFSLLTLNK